MDSLFAKLIVFLSFILGVVTSGSYIDSSISSISLDFNSGDEYPVIYDLYIEHTGREVARFNIESDTPWIFVYKEQEPARKTVEMATGNIVVFKIEVHPEQAIDGSHEKKVTVTAANPATSEEYQTKIITINVNKNVPEATPTLEPTEEPTPTVSVEPFSTVSPTPVLTKRLELTPTPSPETSQPAKTAKSLWLWFWNFVLGPFR